MQPQNSSVHLHRQVWQLTWPMIISNLTVPLLGLVDTAVMGHLDDSRYLAAVAIGATLFSTLYWSVTFLKAGTTGVTAQCYGQADWSRVKNILLQALFYAGLISILFLILQSPLLSATLFAFAPPEEVTEDLIGYYHIRIWGLPASLMTLVITGWYVGQQNTRIPMVLAVLTNCLNAGLNLLFVFGFELGVQGVALGTVVSEMVGLLLGLFCVKRTLGQLSGGFDWHALRSARTYYELSQTNFDYFIRTLFLMFTFIFFTRQGAAMGKDFVAVNELLKNFLLIIALALDGFAHAAEALAGAAWGSRKRAHFFAVLRVITFWSIVTAVILSLLFGLGGPLLVRTLTDLPQIIALADEFIIWIIPLPLVSVGCFLLDGILIGTTQTKLMRNNMIFSTLFVFLPLYHLLENSYANHGLWLAMWGFFIARGIGLTIGFYRRFVKPTW